MIGDPPRASDYTERVLAGRLVRLEIPRIGDSENAYGRTLAYVWLDTNRDGRYEHPFNEDLVTLGLAAPPPSRTSTAASSRGRGRRPRLAAQGSGAPAPRPPGASTAAPP